MLSLGHQENAYALKNLGGQRALRARELENSHVVNSQHKLPLHVLKIHVNNHARLCSVQSYGLQADASTFPAKASFATRATSVRCPNAAGRRTF